MPNVNYPGQHPEAEAEDVRCGTCQWFKAGFGDSGSCQKNRDVVETTYACFEYTQPLMDTFQDIATDKYVLGIRQKLRTNRFRLDGESILEELRSYIIEQDLTKSKLGTKQDMQEINQYLRKIIANRSRVSMIYTSLIDTRHELEELEHYAELWLYSHYAKMTNLKNESMRRSAMYRILPELVPIKKNLKKLMATGEYIDKKLDTAEHTLAKILQSSEKLLYSREGKLGGGFDGR